MRTTAHGFTQSYLRKTSQLTSERYIENANENQSENQNQNENQNENWNQNENGNQNENENADEISNENVDGAVVMRRELSSFILRRHRNAEQVWPNIPGHGSNNNSVNLKFFLFTACVKIFRQLTRQEARR